MGENSNGSEGYRNSKANVKDAVEDEEDDDDEDETRTMKIKVW